MQDIRKIDLTFSQRNGLEPLPKKLQFGELDRRARNILLAVIFKAIDDSCDTGISSSLLREGNFTLMLRDLIVEVLEDNVEKFHFHADWWRKRFKNYFDFKSYGKVFDLIEFMSTHKLTAKYFIPIFKEKLIAARVSCFMEDSGIIVPYATKEEAISIQIALHKTSSEKYLAVKQHLLRAGSYIDDDKWADSIRESIHAVEAAACIVANEPRTTLSKALVAIEKKHTLHASFKTGLEKLYSYTNDERGIRHSLIEGSESKVDMHDAFFMFGACASFVTYLIKKLDPQTTNQA